MIDNSENHRLISRQVWMWLAAVLITLGLVLPGVAQQTAPAQSNPAPQQQPVVQEPAAEQEHKLTKVEADELFKSIDQILAFVSKDTGLPIKHVVKRQLATREFVVQFLEKKMKEDEDQLRLERSEASLKKLRLLPQDFNLRPFMLELLKEQVAGFYDPKSKTVYLLDWVEAEAQKPVMAHELTHALQDQNFDMDKWMKGGGKPKNIQEEMEQEERRGARQAVLEGQGMIALLDYMMAPQNMRVTDAPQLVEAMRVGMTAQTPSSPSFSAAPLFLREAMIFPYSEGMDFVLKVMLKRGTEGAFVGVLQDPPKTSRNIIEPETYLTHESIPPMHVADFGPALGKSWKRWDYGTMGEYDIELMLKQWLNTQIADEFAPSWRGGYYFSYWRSDGKKEPENGRIPTNSIGLIYVSRWASPAKAVDFALAYGRAVGKRYVNAEVTKSLGKDNRIEWSTEEGPVIISIKGTDVFVSESFDPETANRLRDLAFASN